MKLITPCASPVTSHTPASGKVTCKPTGSHALDAVSAVAAGRYSSPYSSGRRSAASVPVTVRSRA